ncbi:MAG: hypothetical protein AAF413_02995 [Patescibacteria group bacterium]
MNRLQMKALKVGGPAIAGFIIFGLASIAMWVFQLYWFLEWWSLLGLLAAIFVPPLATLFPLIYWFQEDFPGIYLLIWLIGFAALSIGMSTSGFLMKREVNKTKKEFAEAFSGTTKNQSKSKKYKDAIDGEIVE